tara:strand:+ start:217 stop:1086 length:870 start_codon:yes stop_codon:yes gene_type:complete
MNQLEFIRTTKVSLKAHKIFNERWVQNHIVEDPTLLGLGDIVVKDEERIQPHAGRLDMLLQDSQNTRYEVELQLGRTDESHIIRTIEYWDIERKRYPQYEHCAVIIAEDITSRFLNVIQLFNGFIPIIAIQMNAYQIQDFITLEFTTILNQLSLGLVDDDESIREVTDRDYWLNKRGTKETVKMVDSMLELIHTFDESYELKYNKYYIGLAKDGIPNNFAAFKPLKKFTWLHLRTEEDDALNTILDDMGADYNYAKKWGNYDIRLTKGDVIGNKEALTNLLRAAYDYRN